MPQEDEVLEPEELKLPPDVQARLRIGRKAEKEAAAAKAELEQVKRQAAIHEAGVPTHPARDVVFANYDGPLEPEAIRNYASLMGIVEAPAPSSNGPTDEEKAAAQQILNAGSAGTPVGSGDIDAAIAMRNAKSGAEVLKIVGELVNTPGFKNRDGLIGTWPDPI